MQLQSQNPASGPISLLALRKPRQATPSLGLDRVCSTSRYAWEREPKAREVVRLLLRARGSDGAVWVELWRWEMSRRQIDLWTGEVTGEFVHGKGSLIGARLVEVDFDNSDPVIRRHPELIERLEGIRATVARWPDKNGTRQ